MSEWKPIVGYDGRYEVSNSGNVRETVSGGYREVGQWPNNQGYMIVRLSGPRTQARVHRLVAQAFVSNPQNKPCINHINCDRADNRHANLEWCTQSENIAHSEHLGRMQRSYWRGRRSPSAKLSDLDVANLRAAHANGATYADLANIYVISKRAVGRIVKREVYADV